MKPNDLIAETIDLSHFELGDTSSYYFENPFQTTDFLSNQNTHEHLIKFVRNKEYLHWFCKYILNVDLVPLQVVVLQELWTKPFPMLIATRGGAKTYILSVYIICRAILEQGIKICVVGAALRQAMLLFNYILNIWDNASVLRDVCGGEKSKPKREIHTCTWKPGSSEVKFLPLGNGETIRGQRAGVVICDEFSSVDPEIFEVVVRGFAAVRSQGLVGNVKHKITQKLLKTIDASAVLSDRVQTSTSIGCNQIIIAGTTSYKFNHFYKYYSYYKAIIESNGNQEYIKKNYPDMVISDKVNAKDYCIMRLPYDLFPEGWMDEAILAQGRATMNASSFDQEYGCIFPADSDGFFPASSIHACCCPVKTIAGDAFSYCAALSMDQGVPCVMGIDPASESDNFAINIIGVTNYRQIFYQWVTNRKEFNKMRDQKMIDPSINDYHTFCIKHIRGLLRRFNVERIICDAGGGGLSIKEGLQDIDKLLPGDKPIYDMEDETLIGNDGQYMLKMMNFGDSEWYRAAHYGLKKDLADRKILFPEFDLVGVANAEYSDVITYENIEDLNLDIEELKREIILIKHTQTPTGQERWDTPKLKVNTSEDIKKSLKKDRFTSLLLSNWGAREIEAERLNSTPYEVIGIKRGVRVENKKSGQINYIGPGAKKLRKMGGNLNNYRSTKRV